MERLLQSSAQTGEPLIIIYLDTHNQISQRTIRVYSMTTSEITAYCFRRHHIRTFKRDGILSIRPANYQVVEV